MSRTNATNLLWGAAYCGMLVALILGMRSARERMIAALDSPAARAEWQEWREDVRRNADAGGPVARRVPSSSEPNLLVLLRDHFALCLTAVLFFSTLLFVVVMFLARGALGRER